MSQLVMHRQVCYPDYQVEILINNPVTMHGIQYIMNKSLHSITARIPCNTGTISRGRLCVVVALVVVVVVACVVVVSFVFGTFLIKAAFVVSNLAVGGTRVVVGLGPQLDHTSENIEGCLSWMNIYTGSDLSRDVACCIGDLRSILYMVIYTDLGLVLLEYRLV